MLAALSMGSCSSDVKDPVNERLLVVPAESANDTVTYNIRWEDLHALPVHFKVSVPFSEKVAVDFRFETVKSVSWFIKEENAAFLTFDPVAGTGSGNFVVNVGRNASGAERSGTFELGLIERDSAYNVIGSITHTFEFTQK